MARGVALFLTVVTGFSGLVYEVTWQKGLAILLGSHSEATAAVLAIFLGGLSLGYSTFGRVWMELVKGTCESRSQDCATLYAEWLHRQPESPARDVLLAGTRTRGNMAGHLSPQRLARLASLYADGPGGALDAGAANALSSLYREYYHHALPFRREALDAAWRRCRGEDCAAGRRAAEGMLGPP